MSDNKINASRTNQEGKTPVTVSEFYTTIDNLYKKVVGEMYARINALKTELNNELKYNSAQINAFCEATQKESAVVIERGKKAIDAVYNGVKNSYQQNQMIHEDLVHLITEDLTEKIEEIVTESLEKSCDFDQITYEGIQGCIDYDKIEESAKTSADGAADRVIGAIVDLELVDRITEKVVESLPYAEVDYKQIEEIVQGVAFDVNMFADVVAEKVFEKIAAVEVEKVDYDRIADIVSEKVPEVEKIDYEVLSDMIVAKMPKPVEPQAIDYETLAEMVTAKMLASEDEKDLPEYDVILDEEGVDKVAEGVFERLDMDVIAEKISAKMPAPEKEELNYDLLADMVADRLAVKVEFVTEPVEEEVVEEVAEEVVEETVEEVVEETVEEVVEEVVEETVEEVVEETVETVEEPAQEEVAAAIYENEAGELVNAETGLVLRLKRSFSAKLKQSDESVKAFYDQIKNELVSYKKVKSTLSWHGDRFNLGRATVAKMNICGKTLCFYVALDPADPELKETVYHQKDVGDQKAYQATPFKIKVKSDMGAKKAVRLVGILAEKIGATKKEDFVPTDYVEEFAYETTQELLGKGLIKETQEKKIDFEF